MVKKINATSLMALNDPNTLFIECKLCSKISFQSVDRFDQSHSISLNALVVANEDL